MDHQVRRLAVAMGDYGPMLYVAAFGPRWGEIAGLRVCNLDFAQGTIAVTTR